jgi:peptidoglycan/LPS O-acetylase OafA/YrhL
MWAAYRVKGRRGVMWAAFAGAAASYALKWLIAADPVRQTGTDLSADALLVGCGLAILVSEHGIRIGKVTRSLILPASGTLVLAFAVGHADSGSSDLHAAIYSRGWWPLSVVASAVLVGACATASVPAWLLRMLEWSPIRYIGVVSYGVYLWHQVPLQVLRTFWDTDGALSLVRLIAVAGISVMLAAASYYLVERRFLALKRDPLAAPIQRSNTRRKLTV